MSDRDPNEPHTPQADAEGEYTSAPTSDAEGEYTSAPTSGTEGEYTSAPQAGDDGHYTDAESVDDPSREAISDFSEETPGFTADSANRSDDTDVVEPRAAEPFVAEPIDYAGSADRTDADSFDTTDRNDRIADSGPAATQVLPPELVQPAEPERTTTVIPGALSSAGTPVNYESTTGNAGSAATAAAAATAATAAAPSAAAPVDRSQYVITSNDDRPDTHADTARTTALEPVRSTATEPYVAPTDPADAAFARPPQRIVYVDAPTPPRKKGNRGVGALIALLSSLVFAILFAVVIFLMYYATIGRVATNFVGERSFYVPVILFAIAFIVLVLLLNRAKWGAYVFGSIFVGLFVYLGTIGALLLLEGVLSYTPEQASTAFTGALDNPLVIAAGLLAREVSLWLGAAVSARGRRVKAKNIEAQAAFERETEARRAEHERANAAPASY